MHKYMLPHCHAHSSRDNGEGNPDDIMSTEEGEMIRVPTSMAGTGQSHTDLRGG